MITEELQFEGNAEDALLSAADAADELSSSVSSANDALGDVDAGGFRETQAAVESNIDATDGWRESIEDANAELKATGDAKGGVEAIGEAFQSVNAALEVGKKAAQVVMAIGKIAYAFGEAVSGAKVFHDQTVAALDQLTGGRGEAALDGLAAKAQGLGISTESAVDQFKALREAGASNSDASALIALRADLDAVGVSGDKADAAVKKALADIKGGKDAGKAIADVAKGFGAVGDGANAAAKRSLTWAGALQNIQGLGGRVFGIIAERAGPALDAVGAKITEVLDRFEDSGAVGALGDVLSSALEHVPAIIDGIMVAWDALMEAAGPAVGMLGESFGKLGDALGSTGDGMSAASAIGTALGYVIGGIANAISFAVDGVTLFIGVMSSMSAAASAAGEMVTSALGAIADFSLADAGTALIQGFIDGILSMAGAVADAAAGVADAAAGAVKSALGIASPSKVGMALGSNLGESVGTGAEEAMPATIDVPDFAPPANDVGDVMPASDGSPGASGVASGSIVFEAGSIVINGSGPGGSLSAADVEQAVRRGVELALERAA